MEFDEFDKPFFNNVKNNYMFKSGSFIVRFEILNDDFLAIYENRAGPRPIKGFYFKSDLEGNLTKFVNNHMVKIPNALKILKGFK